MESASLHQEKQVGRRGLACATAEVRERVARTGGQSPHKKRGLEAASHETRLAIARKGGIARAEQRKRNSERKPEKIPVVEAQIPNSAVLTATV